MREKATLVTRCGPGASGGLAAGAPGGGTHTRGVTSPPPSPAGRGAARYLLAALAVGVVDVVEAVLVDLAQPDVLPDAHQAVGVPPAVPPAGPAPGTTVSGRGGGWGGGVKEG